ncbi:MAG TPA: hypothetical protein VGE29_15740 [Prosthecobacter sp.]
MKTHLILAAVVLVLPCCKTTKVTAPDGTVTETKEVDTAALRTGGKIVTSVTPLFAHE